MPTSSRAIVLFIVLSVGWIGCGGGKQQPPEQDPAAELSSKVRMAQAYMKGGRINKAIELLDEAVAIEPDNAGIRNFRGQALLYAGRYDQAELDFRLALELDPYLTDVHNNLGTLFAQTGRETEAENEYRKALEDPGYPTPEKVYLNLGMLYASQGRDDEAMIQMRKACEIDREYYQAHYELAGLLEKKGNFEEAAREYGVAEPRYRTSGEYHLRLGYVHFRLGNNALAREHLNEVIDVSPGSESAAEADKLLKMLP
jgi:type IV pilus assembly protein PilF